MKNMKANKKIISTIIMTLLVTMAFTSMIILISEPTEAAQNWHGSLDDWSYRKEFTVSNKQSNAEIKIIIGNGSSDGGDGHCDDHAQNDFDDIRFVSYTDNNTFYPYWRENYTSGSQGTFWFNLSDNSSKVWMYYGHNTTTTNGSGNNTFITFIDTISGWSGDTEYMQWHNNKINVYSTEGQKRIYHEIADGGNNSIVIENKIEYFDVAGDDDYAGVGTCNQSDDPLLRHSYLSGASDAYYFDYMRNDSNTDLYGHHHFNVNFRFVQKVYTHPTTGIIVCDYILYNGTGEQLATHTGAHDAYGAPAMGYGKEVLIETSTSRYTNASFDWFFVRKYYINDPTCGSFGLEEERGITAVALHGLDSNAITFSEMAGVTVWSNATTGVGATMNITMTVNETNNITGVLINISHIDASEGIYNSNISLTVSSDNTTWGTNGTAYSGTNYSINTSTWIEANGFYGSNPFSGAGITNGTFHLYVRFLISIPSGATSGTYTQTSCRVYIGEYECGAP
jgi:hypothetical protein